MEAEEVEEMEEVEEQVASLATALPPTARLYRG